MRRFFSILFLLYFSFAIICLPQGDFALLSQLPALYQHCKATEDKDMNFADFITDHLINIDCLFDKHLQGDDQKPHQPFLFHYPDQVALYLPAVLQLNLIPFSPQHGIKFPSINDYIPFGYIAYVFHPPDYLPYL